MEQDIKKNNIVHNQSQMIPVSSIKEEDRERYLRLFSEGSEELYNCLKTMWSLGLNTIACCIGNSETYESGYIFMDTGVDLFSYLPSKELDDDMIKISIDKTLKRHIIFFAGPQEKRKEFLMCLTDDLLTGVKDNSEAVKNKFNKGFGSSYLVDREEYRLRNSNLSEEDIADMLWEYKQKLEKKEEKTDDATIAI